MRETPITFLHLGQRMQKYNRNIAMPNIVTPMITNDIAQVCPALMSPPPTPETGIASQVRSTKSLFWRLNRVRIVSFIGIYLPNDAKLSER
jgi:hypothetical protein